MRVPVSWLREFVAVPPDVSARSIAEQLIQVGFEVESVEVRGAGLTGPILVGRVISIEELTEFKKPIRWCQVDLGGGSSRGIVCGARNFAVGDRVVVAPPGTTLPGGFHITARETYGHVSDGMICSERELGLGDAHDGIIVLDDGAPGDDAAALLGIGDAVLDIAVTPDRGYALSIRGIAREVAICFDVEFSDPGLMMVDLPAPSGTAPHECGSEDLEACALFTVRTIRGFDPTAPTPAWMARRLTACGMRPVSLAVDVTNYVMLELGQPLHAFDEASVQGAVRAGWARAGESLETLDHVRRDLTPGDLTIRDDRGPLALAGTMGGAHSEITARTVDIVLEAAWFAPAVISRMARRHRLSSEASRRFERGVDRVLAPYASARATALLLEFGGGAYVGMTGVEGPWAPAVIDMPADLADTVAGCTIPGGRRALERIGCAIADVGPRWQVAVPSWRPDLAEPADCVEEILRLYGYDRIPAMLPQAPAGFGRTDLQRLRRTVGTTLAATGCSEVLTYPFVGESDFANLRLPDDDPRRQVPLLANPLSDEAPYLRATLLPGLLGVVRRNRGRGTDDVAVWELGRVFCLKTGQRPEGVTDPVRPSVARRPSDAEVAALEALLPDQPEYVAAVWCGAAEAGGWWGSARPVTWADALDAATAVVCASGATPEIGQGADAPFHPGRTALLAVGGTRVGVAGELHPAVCSAYGIPARTVAFEIDLTALARHARAAVAPEFSAAPLAKEDLALVVADDVPAGAVERTLRAAGGDVVEDVRLFDVYTGDPVPAGHRSLAFALRLRVPDRTLTPAEIAAVRAACIEAAEREHGARLR